MSDSSKKWIIGSHTRYSGSVSEVIEKSVRYGMTATQFFYGSPKSFSRAKSKPEDILKAQKLLKLNPMFTSSHFPYVANLAGSMKQIAWGSCDEGTRDSRDDQNTKTRKIVLSLEYELSQMALLNPGSCGVVIHPGNFKNRQRGLRAISETINKIHWTSGGMLLLENSAGQGSVLATTFDEISTIIDGCTKDSKDHVGVCIDTAHIWGYGEYDLSKIEEIDRMFSEFDDIIGLDKFKLLHLNDSDVSLGSKKDRHARLSTGYIWGNSPRSLSHLLNRCRDLGIPAVLETHGLDMIYLKFLEEVY
jgi:deoxyribonuclease-4